MKIALAGNPNSGKTTLFNRLTGLRQRTGNFPGVTVERMEGALRADASVVLTDLPGVYSLEAADGEEAAARTYLLEERPDAILNVLDATSLARGLNLTQELIGTGLPVAVALTMLDELEASGGSVDMAILSRALGVPVFPARDAGMALKAAHPGGAGSAQDAATRLARAEKIAAQAVHAAGETASRARTRRMDRWLMHPVLALPIFFVVMAATLYLTFGPVGGRLGALFGAGLDAVFSAAEEGLRQTGAPDWLRSFLFEGVLGGVGAALGFLPTVLTLFFLLSLIEDSGYMARMACCADRFFRQLGLNGRAFVPLLLGFGCTVPALLAVRTLPEKRERKVATLLLPFCSCSAKLPVYALFSSAFFPGREIFCVGVLYVAGVVLMLPAAAVLSRLFPQEPSPFLLELPAYRLPSVRAAFSLMRRRAGVFLRCAMGTLLPASALLWLLDFFRPGGVSMLQRVAGAIAPAFLPAGFGNWQAVAALMTGLAAKEGILSTFGVLLRAPGAFALRAALRRLFTPLQAASFLTFVLLYTPCAAAFSAARREIGSLRTALCAAVCQTGLAYLAACTVYNAGRMAGFL